MDTARTIKRKSEPSALRTIVTFRWVWDTPDADPRFIAIPSQRKRITGWIMNVAAIGVVILGLYSCAKVSSMAYQDALQDQDETCQMVHIWKLQADQGIPPLDRSGWPPANQWQKDHCK